MPVPPVPVVAEAAIELGQHQAGEYFFTPDRLTLSLYLGSPLALEQRADRGWSGVSVRGDLKLMLPGQERVFRHRVDAAFATIELTVADEREWQRVMTSLRPQFLVRDASAAQLAIALMRATPTTRMTREALASRLLSRLTTARDSESTSRGLARPTLARVLEYLDAHLTEDLSVVDLAAVAGLRPSRFTNLFRNSTGQPPHRYHIGLRVQRACRLLASKVDPTTAAHDAGFYDLSHLTRHMRRILGIVPGDLTSAPGAKQAVERRDRRNVQDASTVADTQWDPEAVHESANKSQ